MDQEFPKLKITIECQGAKLEYEIAQPYKLEINVKGQIVVINVSQKPKVAKTAIGWSIE